MTLLSLINLFKRTIDSNNGCDKQITEVNLIEGKTFNFVVVSNSLYPDKCTLDITVPTKNINIISTGGN